MRAGAVGTLRINRSDSALDHLRYVAASLDLGGTRFQLEFKIDLGNQIGP